MFFLLRMAFWLSVVLILLPSGTAQKNMPTSQVDASDAVSAATATVGDLRNFCTRQPDACTIGSQVATALGYKAQAGAKMLYDVLTDALAPRDTGPLASGAAQSSVNGKASLEKASENTLMPTDLAPAWRGPSGRKDAKPAA